MKITKDSYIEKRITQDHIAYIVDMLAHVEDTDIFTITLPSKLPTISCGLFGPILGDDPIPESKVIYGKRGTRDWLSRMVNRPLRQTNIITAIVGPYRNDPCILYTAFSGPAAPREEGDSALRVLKILERWEFIHRPREIALDEEKQRLRLELYRAQEQLRVSKAFWKDHAITLVN